MTLARAAARLATSAVAAALVLPALPIAGAQATPRPMTPGERITVSRAPLVALHQHDLPLRGRGAQHRASLVAAPTSSPARSTWQVTYTGFDAGSNPNGPAARAAFQAAVDIWSQVVTSPVTIKVRASFAALGPTILGSAGASANYSYNGTSYPSALIDALRGTDVAVQAGGPDSDITAQFSNNAAFYYGTDGADPAGTVDFESVVLHELGHGLGFVGSATYSFGTGAFGGALRFPYDRQVWDATTDGAALTSRTSPSSSLGQALLSQSLFWNGTAAVAANGGVRPRLYAPGSWQQGSSFSHLDESTYGVGDPNSLMTPAISAREVIHSPGPIAVGILADEGWTASLPGAGPAVPSAPSAPSAPTGVTAARTPDAGGSLSVSWAAAVAHGSPVTGYVVTPSIGTPFTTTGTSAVVTGLTNGTSYRFTVTAQSEAGASPASAQSGAAVPGTAPSAPTGVTASARNGSASVTWTAAASNGYPVSGYTVTASPGGATATATSTTTTVPGLVNGTSYAFTVTASNAVGTGPASAASGSVVPAGPPLAPSGVTASKTPGTGGSVDVRWSAAGGNGSTVSGYVVTASPGGRTVTTAGTTATVTGLSNGTAYAFTVRAASSLGTGPASSPSEKVIPSTVPGQVAAVTVAGAGTGSVALSWTPAPANGSPITDYVVTASDGTVLDTQSSTTRVTAHGLTDGTSYAFAVVALNANGRGVASPSSPAITPTPVPDRITSVTAVPGDRSVTVTWAPPTTNGATLTGYVVSPSSGAAKTVDATTGSVTFSGLSNGSSYSYRVRALSSSGPSNDTEPTASVVPSGLPKQVTGLVVSRAGDSSLSLRWTAPSGNGSPVVGYELTQDPGTAPVVVPTGSTLTSYAVTWLTNGEPHRFSVRALNANGTGPDSAASAPLASAVPPAQVTGVVAIARDRAVALSWTAPDSGGAPVTRYRITLSTGQVVETRGSAPTAVITGLTNGTSCTFTVAALNAVGVGAASDASAAVTPAANPGAVSWHSILSRIAALLGW